MNISRAHAMHANPFPWSFPMMHPDWHMLVCHQLPADQGIHAILPIYKMWMRYIQRLMTMVKLLVPLCIMMEDAICNTDWNLRLKTMANE